MCFGLLTGILGWSNGGLSVAMFFIGISAAVIVLGLLCKKFISADFAKLYPDRIEFADYVWPVRWSDVESISWQRRTAILRLRKGYGGPFKRRMIAFSDIAKRDWATSIGYLHYSGRNIEQLYWPEFCVSRAIPLLILSEKTDEQGEPPEENQDSAHSFFAKIVAKMVAFYGRQPLVGALLAPIVFVFIVPFLVSRQIWWLCGGVALLSAWVNIRIVWGQWLQPFSDTIVIAAICLFVLGAIARPEKGWLSGAQRVHSLSAIFWLVMAGLGLPLLQNVVARGWAPSWFGLASLLLLTIGFFYLIFKSDAQQKRALQEKVAHSHSELDRWTEFERKRHALFSAGTDVSAP